MSLKEFLADGDSRKWLYGIAASIVSLIVLIGALNAEQGQAFMNIVAAVLSVGSAGLAIKNVPPKE